MSFLSKPGKIKNNIELVSLHIPKTAGTSFRTFLKHIYGFNSAVRLDINITTRRIDIENQEFAGSRIPSEIRVIHGHFYYRHLIEQFRLKEGIKFITWLREPSERVISNYFYLAKRLKEELNEEEKGLNILSKMQKSLIEYARNDISRNRIHKFLEGADLKDFFFVGLHEHYSEDMKDLAPMMGLDNFQIFQHNITGPKDDVPEEIRKEIRELNALDYVFYDEAIKLREHRRKENNNL